MPAYRNEHPGAQLPATLLSLWLMAIHAFAFVTIGFAILERSAAQSALLANWKPRKLPAARDPNRISRFAAVAEIGATIVLILWWVGVASLPGLSAARTAPVVRTFFWPVLLLSLAGLPVALADLIRPRWTRQRAAMRLAIDGTWVVVLSLLLSAGPWIHLENVPPNRAAEVARWINAPVLVTLIVSAISFLLRAVHDARRLLGRPPVRNRSQMRV